MPPRERWATLSTVSSTITSVHVIPLCDTAKASPAHKLHADVRLIEARPVDEGSWGGTLSQVSDYCCTSHHDHAGNGKVLALLAAPAPIERFALTCISDASLAVLQLVPFSK